MKNYKNLFPIFEKQPNLHYLDSGATTLKPQVMLDKMMEYYTEYSANIHRGLYPMSDRATMEFEMAREKIAKFIGAESNEIIFTSGTTASINLVAGGWGEKNLTEGDELLVMELGHHSNVVPWQQLAIRKNLILKFLPVSNTKDKVLSIEKEMNQKTKLLAITQVSNVLGTVNPIEEMIERARAINPEVCVLVDGAQAVAHIPVDVKKMDCDFYVFSGHKMYGPTGVGMLYANYQRQKGMVPVSFGGGMIKEVKKGYSTWTEGVEKFEGGTPPIGEVIGMAGAVDFINSIGFGEIIEHEKELTKYLIDKIGEIGWLSILGEKYDEGRLGVVALYPNKENMGTAHDIADVLGRDYNVCVRAGHHCAMILHEVSGILTGTTRASLGIYNDKQDIDKFIEGLKDYAGRFV